MTSWWTNWQREKPWTRSCAGDVIYAGNCAGNSNTIGCRLCSRRAFGGTSWTFATALQGRYPVRKQEGMGIMRSITIQGKIISVFPGKSPEAPVIYLNTVSGEGPQIFEQLHKTGIPDVSLITISDLDWNHDLVPWDTPPVFKNAAPCTGGADEYLRLLTDVIVPSAESELPGTPCWRGLAVIPWPDCLLFMRCTVPTHFPASPASPAPSGCPESKNTLFLINPGGYRIVYTFP